MKYHEAANIFPLDEEHIGELAADIKKHGLLCPIETINGEIIDGRRRWLACKKAKVEPGFYETDVPDPIAYVLSLNKERRHLTTPQMGIVAGKADALYEKLEKEGRDGKSEGGKKAGRGRPQKDGDGGPQAKKQARAPRARDKLGKQFGISGRSAERGRIVVQKGIPEVAEAVTKKKLSLQEAEKVAKKPTEEQPVLLQEAIHKATEAKEVKARKAKSREVTKAGKEIKLKGVGVIKAGEAINVLKRIPKNDLLRKRGFQIVRDWMRRNP